MKIHQVVLATAASALGAVPAWATITPHFGMQDRGGDPSNPTATATYTDSLISPGNWQYNVTLNNTGSVPIGVYWFSWVPGAGFLSATPTNIMGPAGWTDKLTNTNASIMWMNSSSPLAGGGSLTFSFDSSESPAQIAGKFTGTGIGAGDWITTGFVYNQLPSPLTLGTLNADGTEVVATAAAPAGGAVPEPATLGLLGLGLTGMALGRRRTKTSEQRSPRAPEGADVAQGAYPSYPSALRRTPRHEAVAPGTWMCPPPYAASKSRAFCSPPRGEDRINANEVRAGAYLMPPAQAPPIGPHIAGMFTPEAPARPSSSMSRWALSCWARS